ncbi:substrate import-associated zinc metallohydrolase lipoprotein [Labilibaculum manganireducens]|uniref:substrate import-associated zinc metallohydrolase lipoprotein n=1 Tax=Labilibaculum manganireducens TaxID=1940525 RepID=UPI0029F53797|nr:substrate import-associated zinc metallohydrolase lipoprotein [Labilibaculum manganireducens]
MRKTRILFYLLVAGLLFSCDDDDKAVYVPEVTEESTDEISVYFRANFLNPYGTAVRWQWVDRYVDDTKKVTPPLRDVCIPMGKFILDFWLAPFIKTEAGEAFMQEHFPPEIIFIGSPMYNPDGQSVTLGYADAGARITFTEVNSFDLSNKSWLLRQLRTAEHEYGHIIHQKNNLPNGYKEVSPENYKSNNWINMGEDVQVNGPKISREAITLGMTSNYGSSDVNEDFCELLSIYLTSEYDEFAARYLTHEPTAPYQKVDDEGNPVVDEDGNPVILKPADDAEGMNEGRDLISVKLKMIKDYYLEKFDIDLDQVRDDVMIKINESLNQE